MTDPKPPLVFIGGAPVYAADSPELRAAQALVRAHNKAIADANAAERKRLEAQWVTDRVGRRFEVIEERGGYDGDATLCVEFTARLVSATSNEGEMVWDNGVTTTGVYLGDPMNDQP